MKMPLSKGMVITKKRVNNPKNFYNIRKYLYGMNSINIKVNATHKKI